MSTARAHLHDARGARVVLAWLGLGLGSGLGVGSGLGLGLGLGFARVGLAVPCDAERVRATECGVRGAPLPQLDARLECHVGANPNPNPNPNPNQGI